METQMLEEKKKNGVAASPTAFILILNRTTRKHCPSFLFVPVGFLTNFPIGHRHHFGCPLPPQPTKAPNMNASWTRLLILQVTMGESVENQTFPVPCCDGDSSAGGQLP